MGKSLGSLLIGKRGRSLGIRWRIGALSEGFLYVIERVLTDAMFLWLTDGGLQMTDVVLQIDNA